jgi:hypothetical protein
MWGIFSDLGDASAAEARTGGTPAVVQQRLRQACDWYARSRTLLASLAASHHLEARYAADLDRLADDIARCERTPPASTSAAR